jgi:hypothetical protein
LVLNEKSPEVGTSVIEVDRPFLPVDSVFFDLLSDVGGLLLLLVSFIEDCDCC